MMGNLKVTFTDVNGVTRTFDDVEEGISLMELGKRERRRRHHGRLRRRLRLRHLPRLCRRRLVRKRSASPTKSSSRCSTWSPTCSSDNSRLGCQIKMQPELDGIEVTVAPSSSY